MPSSRVTGRMSASGSRLSSEYSLCSAAIGWVAWARRIVCGPASESPMWRTVPASTRRLMAPTDSSIGTSGSTRCR